MKVVTTMENGVRTNVRFEGDYHGVIMHGYDEFTARVNALDGDKPNRDLMEVYNHPDKPDVWVCELKFGVFT